MSYNAVLIAIVAGVFTYIIMSTPINPILITNILLGLIAGLLIDRKKS
ncbi:hypothetical protein [Bacillus sp. FJAT-49736]|nr:hypothetical protein [Bacillus sp. FJAT-49736]MBS4175551.1 hypothetical protein [Bacillus sp. FJAT-49736]